MTLKTNICNFAENSTPFVCDETLENIIYEFERNSELAIVWFENNYMKLNTDKCYLFVSGAKYKHSWAKSLNYVNYIIIV